MILVYQVPPQASGLFWAPGNASGRLSHSRVRIPDYPSCSPQWFLPKQMRPKWMFFGEEWLGTSECLICAFSTVLFLTAVVFAGLQDKPAQERGRVRNESEHFGHFLDFHLPLAISERCSGLAGRFFIPRNGAWETFLWGLWAGSKQVYATASCFVSGVKCDPEWPQTAGQCQRSKRRG